MRLLTRLVFTALLLIPVSAAGFVMSITKLHASSCRCGSQQHSNETLGPPAQAIYPRLSESSSRALARVPSDGNDLGIAGT